MDFLAALKIARDFIITDGVLVKYMGSDDIVHIPENVKIIGSKAFYDNKKIREVYLPKNLEIIQKYAFQGCGYLDKVHFNNNLREIEKCAFANTNLKEANLPDTITFLGLGVFADSSLQSTCFPKSLNYIPSAAFAHTPLSEVIIPEHITSIHPSAFKDCPFLKKVILPENLKDLGQDFGDQVRPGSVFKNCTALTEITIPENIEVLYRRTFEGCKKLEQVNFVGQRLQEIQNNCFAGCDNLKKITLPTCKHIEESAFSNVEDTILSTAEFGIQIFCDNETLKNSPKFAARFKNNINQYVKSLDVLIDAKMSLRQINELITSNEDRFYER